ncbi:hemerythrin domain-containing protein [Rhodococcus opacus]|uniref:hemerythrin domain-containing protein n=1 Tax=Rhodococcus opacus TaxID=37919 RepID=UPI000B2B3379|nr:hemerythrin domain-containing protein [Rhodococcus opacus]
MPDQQRDVIDVLTQDHREVERMFSEFEGLTGSDDRARRQDLLEQITIEWVKHSVAEESEVYPAVQRKISEAEAQQARDEHAEAEETMKRLERLVPGEPGFDTELAALMLQIRTHVAEQEGHLFADMRRNFSPQELVDLGSKVEARPDPPVSLGPRFPTGRQDPRPRHRPAGPDARCDHRPREQRCGGFTDKVIENRSGGVGHRGVRE